MMPKTEKELEIYFKLLDLTEAKKQKDRPYTLNHPHQDIYDAQYNRIKSEYFNLVKR